MFAQYRQTGEIGCKITQNYSYMQIFGKKCKGTMEYFYGICCPVREYFLPLRSINNSPSRRSLLTEEDTQTNLMIRSDFHSRAVEVFEDT